MVIGLAGGCVKRATAVETEPLAGNLASYWTCAVTFASDGRGADANEGFTFVPWFEGRVRERGVFEPLGRDESAEAEITLKLDVSQGDDHVTLRVLVIDTRSKAPLGELEAVGVVDTKADAGDATEPLRVLAMRNAADQILDVLKEKRRVSMGQVRRPPAAPSAPDGPPVGGSATCLTQCQPTAASVSSHDEQYRVAAGINATMKELRGCLDRVGAQLVDPAVLLRFSPDGQLRHMRIDVGGYEHLECIQTIKSRPPRSVWTSRASLLRCEYRCTVS
jgi:hypothetical protein